MIYTAIDRNDGTVTVIRSQVETASEEPLSMPEILIMELYNKIKQLEHEKAELKTMY